MDGGTQVLHPSWLEFEHFLGNKCPVSVKVEGHRVVDPALPDLVFQFVFRYAVMPAPA